MATDFSKYGTPIVVGKPASTTDFSKYGTPLPVLAKENQVQGRNAAQSLLGALADPIVKTATDVGRVLGYGTSRLLGATPEQAYKGAAETSDRVPFFGTEVPPISSYTPETIAGRALGTVALGVGSPAAAGALLGAGSAMERKAGAGEVALESVVTAVGGKILEKGFGKVAPYVAKELERYGLPLFEKLSQYIPETAKTSMRNLAERASSVLPKIGEKELLPKPARGAISATERRFTSAVEKPFTVAGDTATKMVDFMKGKGTPKDVDAFIKEKFVKAVRPSVFGKNTDSQLEAYEDKAVQGVKSVVANKNNLTFVDEFGEKTTGRVPQTLQETAEAIEQTKRGVFKRYDELQKTAGAKGVAVELEPVATELDTIANDKVVQDNAPRVAEYAAKRAETLRNRGRYTTQETQDAIAIYNKSLEAFYKNPTYENAQTATVDALIVNKMRQGLDSVIEGVEGAGYQVLKREYGALKTIEKDVVKRAIVDARKNTKGLLDFTDVLSGAEAIRGLLKLNPADLIASGSMKAISTYYKYLNNPNTIIRNMFEGVDRAITASGAGGSILSPKPAPKLPLQSTSPDITPKAGVKSSGLLSKENQIPKKKGLLEKTKESVTGYLKNPKAGLSMQDVTAKLRASNGMSAKDIIAKYPDINLKRDVPVTDIHGKKSVIDAGEALTPYELKGNKVLLQDGETYIVSKNQYQNIKGNAVSGEAKDFAPELKGTEETVKAERGNWQGDELFDNGERVADVAKNEDGTWSYRSDSSEGSDTFKTRKEAMDYAEADAIGTYSGREPKFSSYQLPDGKNYKEVLIKAPTSQGTKDLATMGSKKFNEPTFKSSHWDEPNVISHLRLNERTYQGKKVTFMEELQSDWAREGRQKGFQGSAIRQAHEPEVPAGFHVNDEGQVVAGSGGVPNNPLLKNWQELSIKRALKEAVDNNSEYFAWINGEQTSARYNLATHIDNVRWEAEQSVRAHDIGGVKQIQLKAKDGGKEINIDINKTGEILNSPHGQADWKGKKLDEVLGKGLADSIMAKESGTLSGEGLKFGGEWANNLYDKQVGNIVSDLTGARVETLDLGLPIDKATREWRIVETGKPPYTFKTLDNNKIKVGLEVHSSEGAGESYIITDILGDGRFKAVPKEAMNKMGSVFKGGKWQSAEIPKAEFTRQLETIKETFDISTKKTVQQGIRLTPEIKAKIRGEAVPLKKPSGRTPWLAKENQINK